MSKNIKVTWFGREEELVWQPLEGIDENYNHEFLEIHRQGIWWHGAINGPWYRDSSPGACEDTLEKAIVILESEMKELYECVKQIVEGNNEQEKQGTK